MKNLWFFEYFLLTCVDYLNLFLRNVCKIVVFSENTRYNSIMKAKIDTHTHTIASGHFTTDTATDLARAAKTAGLSVLAITDHSPSVPGSAKESYFRNLKYCEKTRFGVRILYGTEADVLDTEGTLGLQSDILEEMDIVIVSQHPPCFAPRSAKENTAALVAAVRTGKIDIVGHPDDEKYPLFAEELVRACADANTMIELNNASLTPGGYRGNTKERDAELLALCEKHKVVVAMGSDSHGAAHVGNFTYAEALIRECAFPENLLVNANEALFFSILKSHRKP